MTKSVAVWNPDLGTVLLTSALLREILGGGTGAIVETGITTAGDGTLTAAALVGGQVARSGPTAAYTDTTATAAAIQAALQGTTFAAGETFPVILKNNTQYEQTLAAGTGVTLPATIIIPPFSVGYYFGTLGGTAAAPTVVFTHSATVPLRVANAAVNPQATTVSNTNVQTLAAAAIVGGVILRDTQSAARTDTTDIATAIIAASSALGAVGQSFEFTYVNNGLFPITLQGGTGVTLSEETVVPANSWGRFLVTRNASATVTMVGVAQGYFPKSGTAVANGATPVTVADARVTAGSIISFTLKTVGGTVSPNGPNDLTITPGTGFTFGGTALDTSTYNYEIRG